MWFWNEGMGWWLTFGGLFSLLFVAAVIVLVVWAIKKYTDSGGSQSKSNALNIARERYAKGEISKEEFEQLKEDLS